MRTSAAVVAGSAVSRRLLLSSAALWPFLAVPPSYSAGLSRDVLASKLSRVPIFVVTNRDSSPYLTERDALGKRSGFFFLSPQEALAALNDIKAFDPRASLSVVPLDDIWFDVSKSAAEAAQAPQPKAGTSADLRLFRLRPLAEEIPNALRLGGSRAELDDGGVPLFYEPSLRLSVDGRPQRPYFFRLDDLKGAFESVKASGASGLNNPPAPKSLTLAALARALEDGDASEDTLLVAAREAATVVERMQSGDPGGAASTVDVSPAGAGPSQGRGGAVDDGAFFFDVPFANGRAR